MNHLGYNDAGELESFMRGGVSHLLFYDLFGNLKQANVGGDQVSYKADALNRLVERTGPFVPGGPVSTQRFIYRDGLRIAAEVDGSGNVIRHYVYLPPSGHVPSYFYDVGSGRTFRLVTDVRGSVRMVVDVDTGAIEQELTYSPFVDWRVTRPRKARLAGPDLPEMPEGKQARPAVDFRSRRGVRPAWVQSRRWKSSREP